MYSLRNVSRAFLLFEAIILFVPSLWLFIFSLDEIKSLIALGFQYIPLPRASASMIGFLALISGWRILIWLISEERQSGKHINGIWWFFASLGCMLALYLSLGFLIFLPFVIIYLHLIFEDWRQKQEFFKTNGFVQHDEHEVGV